MKMSRHNTGREPGSDKSSGWILESNGQKSVSLKLTVKVRQKARVHNTAEGLSVFSALHAFPRMLSRWKWTTARLCLWPPHQLNCNSMALPRKWVDRSGSCRGGRAVLKWDVAMIHGVECLLICGVTALCDASLPLVPSAKQEASCHIPPEAFSEIDGSKIAWINLNWESKIRD